MNPNPNPDPTHEPVVPGQSAPSAPEAQPLPILPSLAALREATCRRMQVVVLTPTGPFAMYYEPLTATQAGRVTDAADSAVPAVRKNPVTQAEEVNPWDLDYRQRHRQAIRRSRAVGLWFAVPMLREGAPEGTGKSDEAIQMWVEGNASESILDQLWQAVMSGLPSAAEIERMAAGFTQPASQG